ncbi:hypothetical protein ACFL2Q_06420 [Thermodesulfobacteriota bacterium]
MLRPDSKSMVRKYYSARTGKNPLASQMDSSSFVTLFKYLYHDFLARNYFDEAFGYTCSCNGQVSGTLGSDIEAKMLLSLRKKNLWPISDKWSAYSLEDAFDVIEFLYDCVSRPTDGYHNQYCGREMHYTSFDSDEGRQHFRMEINALLRDCKDGYELSAEGEILSLAQEGLGSLIEAELPEYNRENVNSRISKAILKFRSRHSSWEERRDAVRDLADVLEFLRPKLKTVLLKPDENDLFNIANNFGIRHHNNEQKTDYDKPIWFTWMFYYYLATIHAAVRLIEKHETSDCVSEAEE